MHNNIYQLNSEKIAVKVLFSIKSQPGLLKSIKDLAEKREIKCSLSVAEM